MQLKDLPLFLRQLKNFFPDSKLNGPNSQQLVEKYANGVEGRSDISMDDFLRMLTAIERPSGVPFDEHIERTVKKKDEQIAELKDRVKLLTETNESLRQEVNECGKTEIALKRNISQLEGELSERKGSAAQHDLVLQPFNANNQQALRELEYTLEQQPVLEVREKVYGFIDRLLEKTTSLNQDRLMLYDQMNNQTRNQVDLPDGMSQVVADVQRSLQLQAELIQIYEEITPLQEQQVNLQQHSNVPKPDRIEALLQHQNTDITSSNVDNALKHRLQRKPSTIDFLVDSPKIVKRTGIFAIYSLFLWCLGIVTTLMVIEYVSVADWAVADGTAAITDLVY